MILKFKEVKKNQRLCVVDNVGGAYLPIALNLSNHFDSVSYYSVNQNPFPRMALEAVGTGYKQITRVDDFWEKVEEFDIIVMPDIYFNDWGYKLRKMGKMVFGGTEGERLETDRKLFKDELQSVGLSVAPTKYIKGVNNLSKYLKDNTNKWIKMSYFRGEGETTKHINWNQSEIMIDKMNFDMGPLAEMADFIIEDNIDSIAEIGFDGWTINGYNPDNVIWGLEVKDCGYIGKVSSYSELPTPLKLVMDKFQPVLTKYGHTGFYSTEVRCTKDGSIYYTDPCMRAGSPPSNTYMNLVSNWSDVIINGCQGKIVEPKFNGKYGVEIILKSNYCNSNYLPVIIPDEFRQNVNLKGSFYLNNKDYVIPFSQAGIQDMEAFGSVVVIGDDLNTIMDKAISISDSIEAPGIYYAENALQKARQSLVDLKNNLGLEF